MHSHDDKYPPRPGFEPGTPRLQAPVDTNEPSGPATRLEKTMQRYYVGSKRTCVIARDFPDDIHIQYF